MRRDFVFFYAEVTNVHQDTESFLILQFTPRTYSAVVISSKLLKYLLVQMLPNTVMTFGSNL